MALTAFIKFGNNSKDDYFKKYQLSDFHIVNQRRYNKFCPEGSAKCERLEVSLDSPGRDDLDLYNWYDKQFSQEGCIEISTTTVKSSDEQSKHIIYFEDARCYGLSEQYDVGTNRRRILSLAIEAEIIYVDDVKIKRY